MSNYSENNGFSQILERLLANVDDDLDKREGSIIYDALAPAAAELAQCYIALDVYSEQTYLENATGENLDNRVADYGLTRRQATPSEMEIIVYNISGDLFDIDIGSRFAIPNEYGGYSYIVTERLSLGNYVATCETNGLVGNDYIGKMLPLQTINNLGEVLMNSVYKPGENEETDDELRNRAIRKINQSAFAGNKASYRQMTEDIDGIESCKVFPVWNGGGTVKLAIIASGNQIPTQEFVSVVQNIIDPIPNQGEGLGKAPIGHTVTVVAPEQLTINISATLTIDSDYTISQLRPSIENNINEYITEIQNQFSDEDTLRIYISQITAAILNVNQVLNVTNLTMNGADDDIVIQQTGSNIKFPILGEVTLYAN